MMGGELAQVAIAPGDGRLRVPDLNVPPVPTIKAYCSIPALRRMSWGRRMKLVWIWTGSTKPNARRARA